MPSTIQFHSEKFQIPERWQSLQSDKTDFRKYSEEMSPKMLTHKIVEIAFLSALTFGGYIFYLGCTKNGHSLFNQLRKRQIIHYVSYGKNRPTLDQNNKTQFHHKNHADGHTKKLEKTNITDQEIKEAIEEIKTYRELMKELLDIVKEKRGIFIEQLADYAKDRESRLMLTAIEKFLSLKRESHSCLNFLRQLAPFFLNKKNLEIFKNSLKLAGEIQAKDISAGEKAFIRFEKAYHSLDQDQKLDWLLTMMHRNYFNELVEILSTPFYSAAFARIYKNRPELIETEMLPSLANFEKNETKREELKKAFLDGKKLSKQLSQNLTEEKSLIFSVSDFILKYGTDESLKLCLEEFMQILNGTNTPDQIKFFHYYSLDKMDLHRLSKALENDQQAALEKCQTLLEDAKAKEVEEKRLLNQKEVIAAFELLKSLSENYRDTIKLSRELNCLFKAKRKGSKKFECLEKLHKFSFYGLKKPNGRFFREFSPYFSIISEVENQLISLRSLEVD